MKPRLYDPGPRWRSAQARAEFPQAEFEKARADLLEEIGAPAVDAVTRRWIVAAFVACVVVYEIFFRAGQGPTWASEVLFGAALVGLWVFAEWSAKYSFPSAARSEQIAAALFRHGRCPSCAYPVAAPGPDEPAVCPECGAGWRAA